LNELKNSIIKAKGTYAKHCVTNSYDVFTLTVNWYVFVFQVSVLRDKRVVPRVTKTDRQTSELRRRSGFRQGSGSFMKTGTTGTSSLEVWGRTSLTTWSLSRRLPRDFGDVIRLLVHRDFWKSSGLGRWVSEISWNFVSFHDLVQEGTNFIYTG
jgi:hypothetical protein